MAGGGRPVLAVPGRSDRRLSKALRLQVPGEVPPGPGGLLGLELEFSVRSARGGRVHFGSLIHRLALDGTALDPGDPNAYWCSWGGVITSDGAEAEIATPPVRARPGFAARLEAWAHAGEAELRRAVPRGVELDGYSAHFSAAMPARLNDRVCRLYAETFAAGLMLLMDRADSPGLLVRPRPGRTELCGEFIKDEPLAAAAAFVAGSTRACAAAVRRRSARTALPPRLDVRPARAVHRYGWYVDRAAFGTDLHAASRRALLPRASGGTISAQSHLELAWAAARQALADDAAASDLQAAEAMVTGSLPLPAEQGQPDGAPGGPRGGDARFPLDGTVVPDMPHLCAHVRPGYTLRPVAATWDFTVFEASGPARKAYACIPRDSLPGFAAALEEGALDDAIAAYLALSSRRRALSAARQTTSPGLYDRMGAPAGLLAPERDPQTGHQESGGGGAKRTLARPGKRNRQEREAPQKEQQAPRKPARSVPRAAAIGAAIALVLAGGGVAAAMLTHKPSTAIPAPVTTPSTPVTTPSTQVTTPSTPATTPSTPATTPSTPVTTPPILTLPPGQMAEATGPDGAAVTYTATATDLVDGSVPVSCSPASGSTFALGTTTVNCSVTDSGGLTATGSFTVTVQDTTPPSLNLPDITVVDTKPVVVTYTPTATDLVDGSVPVSCSPASGTRVVAPGQPITVNCEATDAHHNTAAGSFTVSVVPPSGPG
ncbi:MAG TPA: HYR domain-containing protein [Streptosporangiaceae bacterium]